MKKIVYKVFSVREYRGGAEDKVSTYVRIDMRLYDGPAYADMDSSVYELDDFQDIHAIYQQNVSQTLEYDYSEYSKWLAKIKRELASLV